MFSGVLDQGFLLGKILPTSRWYSDLECSHGVRYWDGESRRFSVIDSLSTTLECEHTMLYLHCSVTLTEMSWSDEIICPLPKPLPLLPPPWHPFQNRPFPIMHPVNKSFYLVVLNCHSLTASFRLVRCFVTKITNKSGTYPSGDVPNRWNLYDIPLHPKYTECPNTGGDTDEYIPALRIYVKKMLTRNKHTFGHEDAEQLWIRSNAKIWK